MSGFAFKQFKVEHDQCAMKVSTDGILLGAWADLSDASSLLDIGTGTGLLALMCKQRVPDLKVSAVEVDEAAYQQAVKIASKALGLILVFIIKAFSILRLRLNLIALYLIRLILITV